MKHLIALIAIGILIYGAITTLNKPLIDKEEPIITEDALVQKAVTDFGIRIKAVSLQAPNDVLVRSVQDSYRAYVTPGLLQRYVADPTHAPGRETSSPWPERIEIKSMEKVGNYYEVVGEVVYMASTGETARTPAYLTVANMGGRWLVAEYQSTLE